MVHVQIFRVAVKDRQTPGAVFIVANRNSRQCRLSTADYIPAGRDEMDPIAQRRRPLGAMRVVHHHGKAARRQLAANYPVVAANFFGTIARIDC